VEALTWSQESMKLYHYRDKQKNEVDIILEQADGALIGIEVKASSTVRESDFKGIHKFSELVGEKFKYGLVLYTGSRILPFNSKGKSFYAIPLALLWS
jgi:predicted AAA+ superfamily ATPase